LRSKIDILVKGAIICLFYRLSIKELIYKDDLVSVINGIYHSDDTKKSAITSLGFLFESSRDINILLFLYEIYNSEFAGYFLRLHAFKELLSVYFERSIHSNSSIIVECVDMDIYEILSFHEERFKLEFEEIIKFIHIDKNASLLKMLGWEI
jgi:hypothetical protein